MARVAALSGLFSTAPWRALPLLADQSLTQKKRAGQLAKRAAYRLIRLLNAGKRVACARRLAAASGHTSVYEEVPGAEADADHNRLGTLTAAQCGAVRRSAA
ncbi:hypothetical protein [Paraburkholderia phenoliruptrix]|uniref:hypothetical protein n=1 Tax=Paraburkholderia phenoliruptrix TaxID=252970 RepID=UPI0010933D2E|nr:hypothetical protein [Paraburkholderia phenoliruptrix]MBW0445947.1 hypothetical protein [Paraburkholderia phenoliruptrix]MBW9101316.1 hypothetical protein [Paraburkholderia phenoliruptrix]TGT97480.1 hypothetical protein EN798_28830 [bacterium M00.F.Ca.ET.155.01.1.1]